MVVHHKIDFGAGFATATTPKNNVALKLRLTWAQGTRQREVQSILLEWVGDTARKINTYRQQGLSGGKGIGIGPKHRLESPGGQLLAASVVDLGNQSTEWQCDRVKSPLRKMAGNDSFDENIENLSFSFLAKLPSGAPGRILQSDYTITPATRTTHRTEFEKLSMLMMVVFLGDRLVKMITETPKVISKAVTEIAGIVNPFYTVSGIIKLVSKILALLLYLAYVVFLFIQLIKLVLNALDIIYPIPTYKKGMRVDTIMTRVAQRFGLAFNSSVFTGIWKDFIFMPEKFTSPNASNPLLSFEFGQTELLQDILSHGYPTWTAGRFFDWACAYFNAEKRIINGVLHFHRRDRFYGQTGYRLPNSGPKGMTYFYPDPHTTNCATMPMDYFISYEVDKEELNTFQRYKGTCVRNKTVPITSPDPLDEVSKGKTDVRLGVSRALRKNYLNEAEVFMNNEVTSTLFQFLNNSLGMMANIIAAAQSGNFPPSSQNAFMITNNRLGWLELSSHWISIPKVFIGVKAPGSGNGYLLHPQSEAVTAAVSVYNTWHIINTPMHGGQYIYFKNKPLPLCFSDWNILSQNNFCYDWFNKKVEVLDVDWEIRKNKAAFAYQIQQNHTNNLKETLIEDERQ